MVEPIMMISGEHASGDLKLELTTCGKREVFLRLQKMVTILSEVALNDIKEPFRFLGGKKEDIQEMLEVPVRAHILSEIQGEMDAMMVNNGSTLKDVSQVLSSGGSSLRPKVVFDARRTNPVIDIK